MKHTQIIYEVSAKIATIKLNRPEELNAFSKTMFHELIAALTAADEDDAIRAIIITGTGNTFCAGIDLSGEYENEEWHSRIIEELSEEQRDLVGMITLAIYNSKKPIITAINGPAIGAGITMTLATDIRLASRNSKFGFVFTRRGVTNEGISSWFLPRIVGLGKAMEWIVTGKTVEIEEALKYGLINEVCAPDDLIPRAHEIAADIATNTSAISVALCRQLIMKNQRLNNPKEAHEIESKALFWAFSHADAYEGFRSFIEKRPPHFTMRPGTDMPDFYPWWD
jgi:enoyl-CoA hydratase/carnithine racemase